ncbi:uncharacterized protein LOC124303727 [Neodiprion virginianus]|uniref:uncharacterized protein LOC124303727 n=1 Tax=Neodiprion virginianus TaxID=2961670 RepID=UPI001EE76EF1|nr:uncharacterized protein LOC124303727 [Neodiprion virginianus]
MIEWHRDVRQTWVKLLLALLCINDARFVTGDNITRSSRNARTDMFPNSKYVTFNSLGDKIGIDLDLSIPFLSIPLDPGYGTTQPLININAKALAIAGIFTTVSTILVPLLVKPHTMRNYRSDNLQQDWGNYGETINEVFLGNSYLAPCTKRFICSVVSKACRSQGQTSVDKIIDGISSHEWFNQLVEGTAIQEAVIAGRRSKNNCNVVYSGCFLSTKFFGSFPDPTFP